MPTNRTTDVKRRTFDAKKQVMSVRVGMPIIKDIIVEAGYYGADSREICRRVGLRPEELDDGDRWVDLDTGHRVWETAVALSGDPQLGLRIGTKSNPYVVGIVGYLMENCPDIGGAIDVLCRYNPLFGDMFQYRYQLSKHYFELGYFPAPVWWQKHPETARQAIETSMSRTISIIRHLSGQAIFPLQARFGYASPGNEPLYRELLKTVDLVFNAPAHALRFEPRILNLPLASHNRMLFRQFEEMAREKLAAIQNQTGLSGQIRAILLSEAFSPFPSLAQMADRLQMSSRTLQRRLQAEDTNYQQLVDQLRKELGMSLLKKKENSSEEIATALGYSDSRVFRRAIRRWQLEK